MVFKLETKKHTITNTLLYSTVVCIASYAAIYLRPADGASHKAQLQMPKSQCPAVLYIKVHYIGYQIMALQYPRCLLGN